MKICKKTKKGVSYRWKLYEFFIFQGVRFDPDLPQTLRLEFAKSNTKVTKPKQQSPQPAATHPTLVHPITGRKYPPEPGCHSGVALTALRGTKK